MKFNLFDFLSPGRIMIDAQIDVVIRYIVFNRMFDRFISWNKNLQQTTSNWWFFLFILIINKFFFTIHNCKWSETNRWIVLNMGRESANEVIKCASIALNQLSESFSIWFFGSVEMEWRFFRCQNPVLFMHQTFQSAARFVE